MKTSAQSISRQVSHLAANLINNMSEHELKLAQEDLLKITPQNQWNQYEHVFKKPLLYCINKRLMSFN